MLMAHQLGTVRPPLVLYDYGRMSGHVGWRVARKHRPLEKMRWVMRWMETVANIKEERRIQNADLGVLDDDAVLW